MGTSSVRRGAVAFAAALLLGQLAACSPSGEVGQPDKDGLVHVTVAEQGVGGLSAGVAPHLADELGYFEDEGIVVDDFVSVQKGQDAINGMVSGSVTFTHGAPEGIVANQSGAGIVGLAAGWASPAFFMVASPDINEWSDLKGRTIGIGAPNDITAVVTDDVLRKAGLDPRADAEYIPLGATPARVTALLNGQVDATMATLLGVSEAVRAGTVNNLGIAPEGSEQVPLLNSGIQASRKWAEEHRDVVEAYMRAIIRALDYIRDPANEEDVVERLVALNQLPAESNRDELDYVFYNPPQGSSYYPPDLRVPEGVFDSTIEAYKSAGLLGEDVDVAESDFMDYSFVDAALSE